MPSTMPLAAPATMATCFMFGIRTHNFFPLRVRAAFLMLALNNLTFDFGEHIGGEHGKSKG